MTDKEFIDKDLIIASAKQAIDFLNENIIDSNGDFRPYSKSLTLRQKMQLRVTIESLLELNEASVSQEQNLLTIPELEDMIGKPVYMKTICEYTLAFAKRNNIDDDKLFKWVIVDKQLIIEYTNCNGFELYRYEC